MVRSLRGTLLLTLMAVSGLLAWGPAGGFPGVVSAKPPGPKGPEKMNEHLQKSYDALTEASMWLSADRARPPRDLSRLFDQAKDLYREAVKASRNEESRRAAELGLASHDAARGLLHALRANAPTVAGLPAPPAGDGDELEDLLRRAGDHLEDADGDARGPGRAFLDAARRLYDQARRASREDSARALQLARAAEAWTHVGEHINRADDRDVRRSEPERRRDRPLPPEERPRRPRPPRGPERDAPPPPAPEN
jgi:hypothetical protein